MLELIALNKREMNKVERELLEAELFAYLCAELKQHMVSEQQRNLRIFKMTVEKESAMIETNFIRSIVNDILSSKEYTLPGIAYYTDTPEDVIYEVVSGRNVSPTLTLSQKIINLHRTVRPQLYKMILRKFQSGGNGAAALPG